MYDSHKPLVLRSVFLENFLEENFLSSYETKTPFGETKGKVISARLESSTVIVNTRAVGRTAGINSKLCQSKETVFVSKGTLLG